MRQKIVSFATVLCLLIGSLFATASPVAAFTSSCGQTVGSGTLYAVLYESDNYNGGSTFPFGPDGGVLCVRASSTGSTLVPNLKNVLYDVPGTSTSCSGQVFTSDGTWNDCVSSFQVQLDCHHSIAFYQDASYGSLAYSYSASATRATLPFGWDNTFSSLKLTYHSTCIS